MMMGKIVEACGDYGLISIISVIKKILNLVQLIGPILCIIGLAIMFVKLMVNPDDNKKLIPKLKNTFFALLFVFAVPVLINAGMGLLDDSFTLTTCWNYADKDISTSSTYISTNSDENRTSVISDPSDYEEGKEREESSTDSNSSTSTSSSNSNISKRIFLGDSRTVQMYAYLTSDWSGANYSSGGVHVVGSDVFVAQGSMGLAWMKSTGIVAAKQYMTSGSALIILMGVNDIYNKDAYISYINSNYSSWSSSGCKIYFVSVNPTSGSYSSMDSNIKAFNSALKSGLNSNVKFIDSYTYLKSNGYTCSDGLHYTQDTSNKIYNYVKSNL